MAESITFNEDCMAVMARYPDKNFFTIADPPYGLSITARHKAPRSGADTHTHTHRRNAARWRSRTAFRRYAEATARAGRR